MLVCWDRLESDLAQKWVMGVQFPHLPPNKYMKTTIKSKNLCIPCQHWNQDTKICSYNAVSECEVCHGNCIGTCDDLECKYNANPEEWNSEYQWDRGWNK